MTRQLDNAGLLVNDLVDNIQAYRDDVAAHPDLGTGWQTATGTRLGALLRILAGRETELDDRLQEIWDAFSWVAAEGVDLDNLVALLGNARRDAVASVVAVTLTGTTGIVVPAGSRVRVPGGPYFSTDEDRILAPGGVDVQSTCTETGPVEAAPGTVTEIVDAVSGWTGVTNAADAILGRAVETDAELRKRIELARSGIGRGHPDALLADLLALADVVAADIVNNPSPMADSYGTSARSWQPVIWPSTVDQADLAAVLWDHISAGIQYSGAQSVTVQDLAGRDQEVRWSWASEIEMYARVVVELRSGSLTAAAKTAIAVHLASWGNTWLPGADVEPDYFEGEALGQFGATYGIARVSIYVDDTAVPVPPAGEGVYGIGRTEIARWLAARITVEDM